MAYVNGATVEALDQSNITGLEADGAYMWDITKTGNFNWNGDMAHFKTIRVSKEATTPYVNLYQVNNATVIDKVIVESDASVLFNYQPAVVEIAGELTAKNEVAAKIMFNNSWSENTSYYNSGNLNSYLKG